MDPKLLKLLCRVFDVSQYADSGKLLSEMSSWNSPRSWWRSLYHNVWFSDIWFCFIHTSIWQKNNPDTLLSQHRIKKELCFEPKPVVGSSLEPRCQSAFILVENGSGLRCDSAVAEAIEEGFRKYSSRQGKRFWASLKNM